MSSPQPANPAATPNFVPQSVLDQAEHQKVLRAFLALWSDAETNRQQGSNDRDTAWQRNVDMYWLRSDTSDKQPWQAANPMPEGANFIDRFASSVRAAMTEAGEESFVLEDPTLKDNGIEGVQRRFIEFYLNRCGNNSTGHYTDFGPVLEQVVKQAALKMGCVAVTWEPDQKRVVAEVVDASEMYLDPTGRGKHRIRKREIDRWDLEAKKKLRDSSGEPIYNAAVIDELLQNHTQEDDEQKQERDRASGHHSETSLTHRRPVVVYEFLGYLPDEDGNLIGDGIVLCEVVNLTHVIRMPEENPFRHGRDWVPCAPIIQVPMAPYGKSYAETYEPTYRLFEDLTNMILDALQISSIPEFMAYPEMLADPSQLQEGSRPGKMWEGESNLLPTKEDFIKRIDKGRFPEELFLTWSSVKGELLEAAFVSELSLGQTASKSEVTATEVQSANSGQQDFASNAALNLEDNLLTPTYELVYLTALENFDKNDPALQGAFTPEELEMLFVRKKEFIDRPYRVRVKGISSVLKRARKIRSLIGAMNVLLSSELTAQALAQEVDVVKLIGEIFAGHGIDMSRFRKAPGQAAPPTAFDASQSLASSGTASPDALGPAAAQEAV